MRNQLSEFLNALPEVRGKKVYVWGTGNSLNMYRLGFSRIPDFKICAYVDSDKNKQGKIIDNIKVISPNEISSTDDIIILVASPQRNVYDAIVKQSGNLWPRGGEVRVCTIDAGIFSLYKNEVIKAFDSLDDMESKKVFFELIKKRSLSEELGEDTYYLNQYFAMPKFMQHNANEIFIDCGAYVGDTLEQYIWNKSGVFKKIIAFEPDQVNYRALKHRIDRLKNEWSISESKLQIFPYAVSNENTTYSIERIDGSGLDTRIKKSDPGKSDECLSVTLNEYIESSQTIIKADIEGFEYQMLLGAAEGIKKYYPKLAICIYHNAIDMFSIPLFIKNNFPDYKLSVRHHTYFYDETVLYAYL